MELQIEILSGPRQGMRFSLPMKPEVSCAAATMPYVLETEALAFFTTVDCDCEAVSLCLGDRVLPFSQGRGSSALEFELFPAFREKGGREAVLFNYFGVTQFILQLDVDGVSKLFKSAPVEVLARKGTASQAERMVNFILSETDSDPSQASGTATFRSASSGDHLNRVVEQLLDHTRQLEVLTPHILLRPVRALTSEMALRNGAEVAVQSDQSIAWLMDNLAVLEETDDEERAHLSVDQRYYYASEVLKPVVHEHTDIYENRVLMGYLESLSEFAANVLSSYASEDLRHTQNEHQGFVSFFACMDAWIHRVSSQQLAALKECQRRLAALIVQYKRHLPVKRAEKSLPRMTAKVRGHRDYLLVFRLIIQWYQNSKMDWSSQQLFLAINSMPDLFEYYSLLRVRRWLLNKGGSTNSEHLGGGRWHARVKNLGLRLSYEPMFWMVGNSNAGALVNTENRSVFDARNNWVGRSREFEYARRSPDITLEIKRNEELLGLLVLDAKYTTRELAFKQYLPECTMKYVHGIALAGGGDRNVVKAMIILYADSDDEFMDFHTAPFDAYGSHAQLPVLGAQSLSLKRPDKIGGRSLEALLDRLLFFFH